MPERKGIQHQPIEWVFVSSQEYQDPFSALMLDVQFEDSQGGQWLVPAFWAGGLEWRVRFAAPHPGSYTWHSICSDASNPDLHSVSGTLQASAYSGDNPLFAHGPLTVGRNGNHLAHTDGTPFLWLGDTWWMALCRRLHWPADLRELTADRVRKGFTVIQLVAGLYPDMPAFDERGYNKAGHPWESNYARINPAYFDMADERIDWIVRSKLVPCIVGCWGYHLLWLGRDAMKAHWRNLIARYAAYPVVWCLAGEGAMPYYLSEDKDADRAALKNGWTEMARYVRQTDPYHRLVTIHPTDAGRDQVVDDSVLDMDMLQTGHGGHESIENTVQAVQRAVARQPRMPVIEGEVSYEGILEGSREEIQRYMYWACMLSGAAGFTYGANGLWQVNDVDRPYGPSPHGAAWGNVPWTEAYRLPGSRQLGVAKRLLSRYRWWEFTPHQEWITPHAEPGKQFNAFASGIAGEVRVFYMPRPSFPRRSSPGSQVMALDAEATYTARFVDPKTGDEYPLEDIRGLSEWQIPTAPILQDWVLILEDA